MLFSRSWALRRGVGSVGGGIGFRFLSPVDAAPRQRFLKLVNPVRTQTLYLPVVDATSFDPYKVLGLAKGADWDAIKSAYHAMTKLYHPDIYSGVALPPEVAAYLDGRAKQINAAFRLLKAPVAAVAVYQSV